MVSLASLLEAVLSAGLALLLMLPALIDGIPYWWGMAFEVIVLGILLGLLPAVVAKNKGRSFMRWWIYGFLIFIAAMPHALFLKPLSKSDDKEAI